IYEIDMNGVNVFYPPERVLDGDVFGKIGNMGFTHTLADQMSHFRRWFGRESALGQDGYRINRIHNVGTFAINERMTSERFAVHDSGSAMALRRQLNRMARSGTQDQVMVLHSSWDDFLDEENADAYDHLLRWLSNRPWIEVVTLEEIADGEVDVTGDGNGNQWFQLDRGAPALDKVAHEWIHYATRENYDNWYLGEPGFRQGLAGTVFESIPGVNLPEAYGMQSTDTGVVADAWAAVAGIQHEDLKLLASGVLHASTFVTAFHNQDEVNLSKYSDGSYIFPDDGEETLAAFARHAQSQSRFAAIYARVDQWAGSPPTGSVAVAEDIDLDGSDEYLLYNDRLFAVMETSGGRMIAAWLRHADSDRIFQVVGNMLSDPGSDTEFEGTTNLTATRTSALKDWWAGTDTYVNDLYSFTSTARGWVATSSDERIAKTVTLSAESDTFSVEYVVDPTLNTDGTLFVRHGLSPDLFNLLIHGQNQLSEEEHSAEVMTLRQGHANNFQVVSRMDYSNANVTYVNASDVPDGETYSTVARRNQAQTHQVELEGTGSFSFTLTFNVETGDNFDSDGDGLPDWWEDLYSTSATAAHPTDPAANGLNTFLQAYIAGLDPTDPTSRFTAPPPEAVSSESERGIWLRFPSLSGRRYVIWYTDESLVTPDWQTAAEVDADAEPPEWLDEGDTGRPNPMDVDKRFYQISVELDE
ncbi:MAG: hypothetical protein PF795_13695, partial [Kiritimatiellae bacterium]|nr:hypothetical protein [Kiritimatiellia bacterium]